MDDFDGAFKQRGARPGRRRKEETVAQHAQNQLDEDHNTTTPAPKKTSGWAENVAKPQPKPSRRRAKQSNLQPAEAEHSIRNRAKALDDDDDDDAAFIPDLENAEEDFAKQVASAPGLKASRVQTIDELDGEIDYSLPSTHELGIDLGVLHSYLVPPKCLHEEDAPWDVERELHKIAADVSKETDP